MNRPVLVITHASFSEHRVRSLARLVTILKLEAPKIPILIIEDKEKKGSLWCWRKAMEAGLQVPDATHIVWLPDDVVPCKDFGAILQACIDARPDDVFDCFVNHPFAEQCHGPWYSTYDGYVGVGGVMPRDLLVHHLRWRDRNLDDSTANDAGVNLWAMATRRWIYKTGWSLLQHDQTVPSLEGHDFQPGQERGGLKPVQEMRRAIWESLPNFLGKTYRANTPEAARASMHLGLTYKYNHLALLDLKPPRIETYFDVQRTHGLLPDKRKVFIASPAYRGMVRFEWAQWVFQELVNLAKDDIECEVETCIDSLISRSRNNLVSSFLQSDASHLLFCDVDNYPTKPGAVKALMDSGHGLVGGAVPLKDGSGTMFATKLGLPSGLASATLDAGGCMEALHMGTGFMMITREAVLKMCAHYHEQCFYLSANANSLNRAEWHLFSDTVQGRHHLSEDWEFCRKWMAMGEKVYLYPAIDFVHWGDFPFKGSFMQANGFREVP